MKSRPVPPLITLALTLLVAGCGKIPPRIASIDPQIGYLGDTLTIRGEGFGEERGESYVLIGGIVPTISSYYAWEDDYIAVKIPEFGDSGLVYVYRNHEKSNPALFSNRAVIPQAMGEASHGITPRINALEPKTGYPGSLVVIQGSGFGASREGGGVYFAWSAEASPAAPEETKGPGSVEVFEQDLGYELWSDREIRVRVPSGAVSGEVTVKTLRGMSGGEYFTVAGMPGTKTFRNKRSYAIGYSTDIQVREASSPNALYLWAPEPALSASQRKVELLSRNIAPFMENYRGASLFQFKNLQSDTSVQVSLSYLVEVYSVETSIRTGQIPRNSDNPPTASYTLPSPLIPSNDDRIKQQAALIIGRETNPYLKAEKIYRWLIGELEIQMESLKGGAIEALEDRRADPYMAALLYVSLARAAGIPAIPIAGVLTDRYAASPHYWAEFWINGFGWVPLDPALGSGAAPGFTPSGETQTARDRYYFGNMDNQHIAFSRGQTALSPMEIHGRLTVQERSYALQTLWEEAAGGLESYSSLWRDVMITGIYAE